MSSALFCSVIVCVLEPHTQGTQGGTHGCLLDLYSGITPMWFGGPSKILETDSGAAACKTSTLPTVGSL